MFVLYQICDISKISFFSMDWPASQSIDNCKLSSVGIEIAFYSVFNNFLFSTEGYLIKYIAAHKSYHAKFL